MSTPANKLTADLLIEIPKRYPQVRVWRNNRVDAVVTGAGGRTRRIKAGIDGQADICGICSPRGMMVQIEVKAGRDQMRESQKNFREMIVAAGGLYLVARSVEQCLEELGRWV